MVLLRSTFVSEAIEEQLEVAQVADEEMLRSIEESLSITDLKGRKSSIPKSGGEEDALFDNLIKPKTAILLTFLKGKINESGKLTFWVRGQWFNLSTASVIWDDTDGDDIKVNNIDKDLRNFLRQFAIDFINKKQRR